MIKRFQIVIDDDTESRLQRFCKDTGFDEKRVVRLALLEYFIVDKENELFEKEYDRGFERGEQVWIHKELNNEN